MQSPLLLTKEEGFLHALPKARRQVAHSLPVKERTMNARRSVVSLIVVVLVGFLAAGRTVGPPRPRGEAGPIKKGVTPTAAKRLQDAGNARIQEYLAQDLAAGQERVDRLRVELAAEERALRSALKADPRFADLQTRRGEIVTAHQTAIARIEEERRQPLERRDQAALARIHKAMTDESTKTVRSLDTLAKGSRSVLMGAAGKAGLTDRRIQAVLAQIGSLPKPFRIVDLVVVADEESETETPAQPTAPTSAVFTPLFDTGSTSRSGTLIGFGSESWSADGATDAYASAVLAGAGTHAALVGSY
jgi:hypothetical protein